jgi:hypothetical protein
MKREALQKLNRKANEDRPGRTVSEFEKVV